MSLSFSSSGKISYFTHPPETHTLPTHISAEIVAEMSKAFDFEALEQDNEKALASRCLSKMSREILGFGFARCAFRATSCMPIACPLIAPRSLIFL